MQSGLHFTITILDIIIIFWFILGLQIRMAMGGDELTTFSGVVPKMTLGLKTDDGDESVIGSNGRRLRKAFHTSIL